MSRTSSLRSGLPSASREQVVSVVNSATIPDYNPSCFVKLSEEDILSELGKPYTQNAEINLLVTADLCNELYHARTGSYSPFDTIPTRYLLPIRVSRPLVSSSPSLPFPDNIKIKEDPDASDDMSVRDVPEDSQESNFKDAEQEAAWWVARIQPPKNGLFSCPFILCDQSSAQKGHIRRHIRIRHFRIYPFSCSQCGKGFCDKTNLEKHHRAPKVPCRPPKDSQ